MTDKKYSAGAYHLAALQGGWAEAHGPALEQHIDEVVASYDAQIKANTVKNEFSLRVNDASETQIEPAVATQTPLKTRLETTALQLFENYQKRREIERDYIKDYNFCTGPREYVAAVKRYYQRRGVNM